MPKVLIIDDEKDIQQALRDILVGEHMDVVCSSTGAEGLTKGKQLKPDVILLDLRLPDMDGYDVCRRLKESAETRSIPILILSTRSRDSEKVIGLEIGADDYITKPYNPLELVARIRVALRRRTAEPASDQRLGNDFVSVEVESRQVKVNGKAIRLTRKEFDLLVYFLRKPSHAHSRTTLMNAVWGEAYESMQGTVDSHIKTLRKKLQSAAECIETVPGIGYRWRDPNEEPS